MQSYRFSDAYFNRAIVMLVLQYQDFSMLEAKTSIGHNIDTLLQAKVVICKGLDVMIDTHVKSFETQ